MRRAVVEVVAKPDYKWCRRCRQTKPIFAFGPHTRTRDRLHSWCRACKAEAERLRRHPAEIDRMAEALDAMARGCAIVGQGLALWAQGVQALFAKVVADVAPIVASFLAAEAGRQYVRDWLARSDAMARRPALMPPRPRLVKITLSAEQQALADELRPGG